MYEKYYSYRFFIRNSQYCLLILLSVVSLKFSACSTPTPSKVVLAETPTYFIDDKTGILIIPPKITFERKDTGQQVSEVNIDTEQIEKWICNISKEEIKEKEFLVLDKMASEKDDEIRATINSMKECCDQLVRPNPKISYLEVIKSTCGGNKTSAVLLQYLRVKVGSDEEWSFIALPPAFFGMMPKVKKSTSSLRSVIRECSTGKILWQNELFIRELPNMQSKTYEKFIRSQFINLARGG